MTIYSLDVLLSQFGTSLLFHSGSNHCFLACIQISQEAGKMVWYSHLLRNFPQFFVIHMVKGFGVINKAEVEAFLVFSWFSNDPTNQTWAKALSNSMKLWAMVYRATQDRRVMVESSDKTWSTGEGNGKPLHYSCLENPMNSMKRQKDMILKDELPRSVGAQNATREEWRNNPRKNKKMEPKWKQCPFVDVTGDESKIWCCKDQYCIWTWIIRSTNQGKLEMVKQEMARVNINI